MQYRLLGLVQFICQSGESFLIIFFEPGNSIVCKADDPWPEAMANYSAILQCDSNEIGFKSRNCTGLTNEGSWEDVISQCVNTDIWALLIEAQV